MRATISEQSGCFLVLLDDGHQIEICGEGYQSDKAAAEAIATAINAHAGLVNAARETFKQLGTDYTWHISTLRLDIVRPALQLAGITV